MKLASLRCFVKQWPQNSNFKEKKTYKQVLYIGNIKTRKTENELQCIAGMSGRSVKVCLLWTADLFCFSPPVSPYLTAVRGKTGYPLFFSFLIANFFFLNNEAWNFFLKIWQNAISFCHKWMYYIDIYIYACMACLPRDTTLKSEMGTMQYGWDPQGRSAHLLHGQSCLGERRVSTKVLAEDMNLQTFSLDKKSVIKWNAVFKSYLAAKH